MSHNKQIIRVLVVVCVMFLSLVTYLLYFNMFEAEEVASNPYNKRQWEDELNVKRGNIYDRDGVLLAETIVDGDSRTRNYPKGRMYSHIIGYYSRTYGKSNLEMRYDKELNGHGDMSITLGELREGYNLNLTIDNDLQKCAYDQLAGRNGAVVALDPKTGKILAMVSYPDFDPSAQSLEKNWAGIVERKDSPLLARATHGLYPPGSTYKIVTTSAAYEEGKTGQIFNDTGSFKVDHLKVDNYGGNAYGNIDIQKAFEVSSNFVFCSLGYEMGGSRIKEQAEKFGVNQDFGLDFDVAKSRLDRGNIDNKEAALVSIGQGSLLMTPLNVAMMGGAIANNGKIMKPYLVESVSTSSGLVLKGSKPKVLYDAISPACADYVGTLMEGVVRNGTGKTAKISGINVAAKTGTAENETGKDHAWFLAYAPAENPQIVVAVILEYDGGAGGTNAGPVARNVIKKYLGY